MLLLDIWLSRTHKHVFGLKIQKLFLFKYEYSEKDDKDNLELKKIMNADDNWLV